MTDGSSIGDVLIACIQAQSMEVETGNCRRRLHLKRVTWNSERYMKHFIYHLK